MAYFINGAGQCRWPQETLESVHEQLTKQVDSADWAKASDGLVGTHTWYLHVMIKSSLLSWLVFWGFDDVEVKSMILTDLTMFAKVSEKGQRGLKFLKSTADGTGVSFVLRAPNLCSHVYSHFFLWYEDSTNIYFEPWKQTNSFNLSPRSSKWVSTSVRGLRMTDKP